MPSKPRGPRPQVVGVVPRFDEPEYRIVDLFHVHPARPVGEQVKNTVLELITRGIFREGKRLPSVASIAEHLGVASGTIFRAFADLAEMKVIVGKRRSGYIVGESKALYEAVGVPALSNAIFACRRLGMNQHDLDHAYNLAIKENLRLMRREKPAGARKKKATDAKVPGISTIKKR